MKLSAPVYRLKRNAQLIARADGIPLHAALDRIAAAEGFRSWSLLAAKLAERAPAARLFPLLAPGDLVLIGARPGQGKTLLGLDLVVEAMKAGHHGAVFTLEDTMKEVHDRFRAIGTEPARFSPLFSLDISDAVCASHIMATLATAPRGTLAVIDYLQLLDRRREHPDLTTQVQALAAFARERGLILVFLSQIDRSYDPAAKPCPDVSDVRLANPLDLSLFGKSCFLHAGEIRFRTH